MVASVINTTIATIANLSDARIQILLSGSAALLAPLAGRGVRVIAANFVRALPNTIALPSNRLPAHHGLGPAGSVVPLFQQVRDRYKIDSTFMPAARDASAFSTIGPVISTSWPTWKFSISWSPCRRNTSGARSANGGAPAIDGRSPPLQSVMRNSPFWDFATQPIETKLSPRSIDLA